ncbi:hypothetical protein UPYG_G00200850 [Umbra pygmaea]|uniref:PIH1 domain-containing protein 2 n=1 Tax=Umbra pygmaea TaxID=75934 RepID=A0ABD0WI76_UMBPY
MSSLGCNLNVTAKEDLQPINQLWSMLEDLSQNHPERYQKLMKNQMKQRTDYCAPPQPNCCLQTELLEPKKGLLFINLCGWKRVPAPLDENKPVSVIGGQLETETNEGECYSVVDVAVSPVVLEQADRAVMNQVHLLAMRFTQQKHGLRLSQKYTISSCKLKGCLKDMLRRFSSLKSPSPPTNTVSHTPASLIQQISSLREGQSNDSTSVQFTTPVQQNCGQGDQSKNNLIQVISSSVTAQPQRPKHQLTVYSDGCGLSRSLELTVELPKVRSIADCHLSISQDDVLLEVEEIYHLYLVLPENVKEESATATFNKNNKILRLLVSLL